MIISVKQLPDAAAACNCLLLNKGTFVSQNKPNQIEKEKSTSSSQPFLS
jgi:hypothetical protein